MMKPPNKPTTTKIEKPGETLSTPTAETSTTEPSKDVLSNVASLADSELEAMLKVLRTEVRRREKEREASRPKVGSKVRILRGRPKYVGKIGTAVVVRKSRCFIAVPEINSPAYVLISDVELVEG